MRSSRAHKTLKDSSMISCPFKGKMSVYLPQLKRDRDCGLLLGNEELVHEVRMMTSWYSPPMCIPNQSKICWTNTLLVLSLRSLIKNDKKFSDNQREKRRRRRRLSSYSCMEEIIDVADKFEVRTSLKLRSEATILSQQQPILIMLRKIFSMLSQRIAICWLKPSRI